MKLLHEVILEMGKNILGIFFLCSFKSNVWNVTTNKAGPKNRRSSREAAILKKIRQGCRKKNYVHKYIFRNLHKIFNIKIVKNKFHFGRPRVASTRHDSTLLQICKYLRWKACDDLIWMPSQNPSCQYDKSKPQKIPGIIYLWCNYYGIWNKLV